MLARIKATLTALLLTAGVLVVSSTAAHASLTYFYSGFKMTATTNGLAGNVTVANPTVTSGDFHSLMELAVSTTNQQNAVEIGWTVDPGTYGDNLTHVFATKWVGGVFGGYSDATWVDNGANPVNRGASISTGYVPFGIVHSGTNWWFYYNSVAIGSFPDSAWSGTFTQGGLNQAFGEVAANVASPTTLMGDGNCATATTGAKFGSLTNQGGPTFSGTPFATNTAIYNYYALSTRTLTVGGDGSCP